MGKYIYNPGCTACSLHKNATNVCIPASGRVYTRALVVGEAPGKNEDLRMRPFCGRAGEILDLALSEAFSSDDVRVEIPVTNVVKCRPPGNRDPSAKEIKTCMDLYFDKELELFNPIAILALGNVATEALLGYGGISSLRGTWVELDSEVERWVMPTWHPAYIGYQGGVGSEAWVEFLADCQAFAEMVAI